MDEDLQAEYDAVKATGLFDIRLFGYDKWFNEDKSVISEVEHPVLLHVGAVED